MISSFYLKLTLNKKDSCTTVRLLGYSTPEPEPAVPTAEEAPAGQPAPGGMTRKAGVEVTLEDPQAREEADTREVEIIWEVVDQRS